MSKAILEEISGFRINLLICHRVESRADTTDISWARRNKLVRSMSQVEALFGSIELRKGEGD
jgi:hypothetical protein